MKSPRLLIAGFVASILIGAGIAWYAKSDKEGVYGPEDDDGDLSVEAVAALDAPDTFYLYSLDPVNIDLKRAYLQASQAATNAAKNPELFHGYEILGRTEVVNSRQRKELVDAFKRGIEEGKGPPPACFDPRHGIRVVKSGLTVDFVICFECVTVSEVISSTRHLRISRSPRDVFNNALKRANLPLAPEE
jgi:hypothetical protein